MTILEATESIKFFKGLIEEIEKLPKGEKYGISKETEKLTQEHLEYLNKKLRKYERKLEMLES